MRRIPIIIHCESFSFWILTQHTLNQFRKKSNCRFQWKKSQISQSFYIILDSTYNNKNNKNINLIPLTLHEMYRTCQVQIITKTVHISISINMNNHVYTLLYIHDMEIICFFSCWKWKNYKRYMTFHIRSTVNGSHQFLIFIW